MLNLLSGKRPVNLPAFFTGFHSPLHRSYKGHPVAGAENNPGAYFGSFLRAELRVASAYGNHRSGVLIPKATNRLTGFSPALRGYCAGVHNDRVRSFPRADRNVPILLKAFFHRLRFKLIDLTSQRCDQVFHPCAFSCAVCSRDFS